jgi:hypothetical protein
MSLLLIQQYNADEQVIVARLIEKTMPREISYSETASEYSLHGPRRIQRRKRYSVDNLCKIFYSYIDQTAKLTTKCKLVRFPSIKEKIFPIAWITTIQLFMYYFFCE